MRIVHLQMQKMMIKSHWRIVDDLICLAIITAAAVNEVILNWRSTLLNIEDEKTHFGNINICWNVLEQTLLDTFYLETY